MNINSRINFATPLGTSKHHQSLNVIFPMSVHRGINISTNQLAFVSFILKEALGRQMKSTRHATESQQQGRALCFIKRMRYCCL